MTSKVKNTQVNKNQGNWRRIEEASKYQSSRQQLLLNTPPDNEGNEQCSIQNIINSVSTT